MVRPITVRPTRTARPAFGAILIVFIGAGTPALASDPGCDGGKWSLAREQDLLPRASPAAFNGLVAPGQPVTAKLLPTADLAYSVSPQRAPGPGSHGAILRTSIPKAGLYQVTLSDRGWIDVLQNGRAVPSGDFTEAPAGCPGLKKSVRFELVAGPTIIQISGAPAPSVTVILTQIR